MASAKWPAGAQDLWASVAANADGGFPHPLGARCEDIFGRVYRYVSVGIVDLVVGNCIQSSAQITTHQQLTPSAAAVGDKTITATSGATAAAANDYAGGIAVIDTTPGLGISYPIKGHAAWTSGAVAGGVVLQLADGWNIVVALTTVSRVSIQANPFARVIQTPQTTLTGAVAGVCQSLISANQGGWIGTQGHFGTLIDGTPGVGFALSCPASVAGGAAINSGTLPIIGNIMVTGVSGKVQAVKWNV